MKPASNKTFFRSLGPLSSLAAMCILSGCTSIVWDENAFNSYCRPANPTKLELYYSSQRKDILVRYDEFNEHNSKVRHRSYWLMANAEKIGAGHKPHFIDESKGGSLIPIPVAESAGEVASQGMGAVARKDDDAFTLYSSGEKFDPYSLPIYRDPNRRAKQIALTPAAFTIDATLIGAVIALYNAPEILAGLSR